MNVIFLEPAFPANQRAFVIALRSVGATVIGIGERPLDWLDDELKGAMTHYEQIGSVVDEPALFDAVKRIQGQVWVDRLEATIEAHIMAAARVREACGIPGTSTRTAYLCRDKPAMKEVLRQHGIPTAESTGASSAAEVEEFVQAVGFPVILKPRDAAGASGTHRADDEQQLADAMSATGVDRGASIAVEEFVEGHEGFYDTIAIDGQVVHEFVSHYYPNVLDAMRHRWISPQFVATNRVDEPGAYDEVKRLGRRVNDALGIGTSATHMEWFFGPKGLKFSEIGCRPPGVRAWDLYAVGNDIDIYREWAHAVVHGGPAQQLSRRFAAGIVALRPDRDGSITGYSGLEQVQERFGPWIIDHHVPPEGTATQPVEAGYMANAWIRLKHPDYDELRAMLDEVGRTVQVHALMFGVAGPRAVTLLGPQRFTPTLPQVIAAAGIDLGSSSCGPMATVTAGWQEREDDDKDLVEALLDKTVNVRLYARTAEIFTSDPELAEAHGERGRRLQDIQALYEVRLSYAMDAVYELLRRADGPLVDDEVASALEDVRALDRRLLELNAEVRAEFVARYRPAERDGVAHHRGEVAQILGEASGLAIAGGQVPTLLNRLNLLGVADHVGHLPVFAWSAGAMVVTERIVVFHDDPPHGRPHSRVFEAGLGWVTGLVAMPHARRRLHLHEPLRVSLLARRFTPATCVGFDDGAHMSIGGRLTHPGILELAPDGSVAELAA